MKFHSEVLKAWDVSVSAFKDNAGKTRSLTRQEQEALEFLFFHDLRTPVNVAKGK